MRVGKRLFKKQRKMIAVEAMKKRDSVMGGALGRVGPLGMRCYNLLEKYFESKGKKHGEWAAFFDIYLQARQTIGSLKGKRVLTISEDPTFESFLREVEGANVIEYGNLAQWIESRLREGNFKLILAGRVFEPDAFEHFITDRVEKEAAKAMQRKSFQRFLDREQPTHYPLSELGRLELKHRELYRFERADLLRQLAAKLEKGGYLIATGSGSKPIFGPQDATKVGFKIIKMSECHPYWPVTVLQKK